MKIKGLTRIVLQAVIGAGVNEVLSNLIKSSTPVDITPTRKVIVKIGEYAISNLIAGYVANKTIEEAEELLTEIFPDPKPVEKKEISTEEAADQVVKTILKGGEVDDGSQAKEA